MSGIIKIVSGGQTGCDWGGLCAGQYLGLETGGFCCQGWMNELGKQELEMKEFGLVECPRPGYPARTELNVKTSDGTLIVHRGGKLEGGSYMTDCCCESLDKPRFVLAEGGMGNQKGIELFLGFVERNGIKTLNCAGPRASKWADGQGLVFDWLIRALEG